MKKKLMRMIAGILFVCMMLGNMSVAYGAETDAKDIQTAAEGISEGTTDTEKGISEEGTGQTANPENGTEEVAPSGEDNAADAAPNTAAPDSAVNGTADAMSTGAVISGEEEKETEVLQENEQSDSIINFVYIERELFFILRMNFWQTQLLCQLQMMPGIRKNGSLQDKKAVSTYLKKSILGRPIPGHIM